MASPAEIAAMRRAIALSAFGLGGTSPNPPVGCVILNEAGHVVGEGYHARKGEPHAEAHALAAAGQRAHGGTAVVTLEPCNHQGRTPPCRQALLEAGIARVVIALIDTTSRGEGGAAVLRDAGVDVEEGVLPEEARHVLRPWLTALGSLRPSVTWVYQAADPELLPLSEDAPELGRLLRNSDAVLSADGRIQEAVSGTHRADILRLRDVDLSTDPKTILDSLYADGVRELLINGGVEVARTFLDAGLIDRIAALLAFQGPSAACPADPTWWLPGDFTLTSVARLDTEVCVEAQRLS